MMQKDAPNWNIVITKKRKKNSDCKENLTIWGTMLTQGVKLIFFSGSHLAPKFFKVVANSKKVGRHF